MKATKLTPIGNRTPLDIIRDTVCQISVAHFSGNLKLDDITASTSGAVRFKLGVSDSYGPGSRTAPSGRHGPYASWEANRLVMAKLFDLWPEMTLVTARVTYRGRAGFNLAHQATGDALVGHGAEAKPFRDL